MNPGAELGIDYWTVTAGYMESLEAYECDGVPPYSGEYYFAVGALCNSAGYAEAEQEINISDYSDCVDAGLTTANYGGYLSNWGGSDHPEMIVLFLDENSEELDHGLTLDTYNSNWTLLDANYPIPAGTRDVHMVLMGTRYSGDDNDSYFDDLFFKVWMDNACLSSGLSGDLNQDDLLNILDIIIMVNIILNVEDDQPMADMNGDGMVDILDVITLINMILDR